MDALRELSSTVPLEKQDHETSGLSSRRLATPSTSSKEASKLHNQSPEGGSPSLFSVENYKLTPDTASSTIELPSSSPLEARPFSINMDSLPLSPSNSHSEPLASGHPSWSAMSRHDHRLRKLNDYYAELEILMMGDDDEVDGNASNTDNVMGSDKSSNTQPTIHHGEATHNLEHRLESNDSAGTPDDLQPYRHGQPGVFKHFSRFDQASRPIASDNWRAKSAAESRTRPQLSSLITGNSTNNMANLPSPATSTSYSHFYKPTRSPLTAPLNSNIASFIHSSPNLSSNAHPPPTPVSLSTPTSMAFTGHSPGYDHAHHSSGGSFGAPNGYSPTLVGGSANVAPTSLQADSMALQMNSLRLHHTRTPLGNSYVSNNRAAQMNTGGGYSNGQDQGMATFPVSISDDTLAYCFIRPNGTHTRLVPVDMLPYQLQGVPAHETGNERLVSLPVPAGVEDDGRSTNNQVLRPVVSCQFCFWTLLRWY